MGLEAITIREGRGVLVLDHYGFGNVVMSIPLLRAICAWAGAHHPVMVLLESREHFQLLESEGLEILPFYYRPDHSGVLGLLRWYHKLRDLVDLVLAVPQVPAENAFMVKLAAGARYSAGEALGWKRLLLSISVEKGWNKSILATQVELIRALGIAAALDDPLIRLTEAEVDWGEAQIATAGLDRASPLVGVHCSAVKSAKKWPAHFFGEVIAELKSRFPRLGVISFGSIAEQGDANAARLVCPGVNWIEGAGAWSLRQSLAMLKQCDLVISGDTGIMHMAAAIGARTLSVFGPTSARRLAPEYNGGKAIFPDVACHPCYRDRDTRCKCIRLVSPEGVVRVATEMLGRDRVALRAAYV